jgi:translocator protein
MGKILRFTASVLICEAVGFSGVLFTFSSIATWYARLNKPFFNPPDWIFGPVWTALYFLMGVTLYYILQDRIKYKRALLFFSVQLILNFFWTVVFFGLHQTGAALVEIIFLWVFIFLTIIESYKISKTASFVLIPYILWVSFAAILNLFIVLLNK